MTYSPWAALRRHPNVSVEFAHFADEHGWYDPESQTIWLDPRDGQAVLRTSLAHELEHHLEGSFCVTGTMSDEWFAQRQESRVDQRAATKLIPLDRLIDALLVAVDEREIAEELWVDAAMVRVRLDNLTDGEKAEIDERLWAREWGTA